MKTWFAKIGVENLEEPIELIWDEQDLDCLLLLSIKYKSF